MCLEAQGRLQGRAAKLLRVRRQSPGILRDWCIFALQLTFGGMCSWRRVGVARVFALVVRCRVMRLLVYSRVGKNRDTRRESPAGAGAGRTADHNTVLFSQKIVAVQKPIAYTDLLCLGVIISLSICFIILQ